MLIYAPPHRKSNKIKTAVRYGYSLYIGKNRTPGDKIKGVINENIECARAKFCITRIKRKHGMKVCPPRAHLSWFWQLYLYEGKYKERTILKICKRKYTKIYSNGVKVHVVKRVKVNSLRRMKIKLGNNKELYS